MSGPIGVRGWRLHLPKQTDHRSKVLQLSLWITPLSHLLVSQRPVLTTHYSKFIYNMQTGRYYKMLNCGMAQILKETLK